jgi:hypothetical protein
MRRLQLIVSRTLANAGRPEHVIKQNKTKTGSNLLYDVMINRLAQIGFVMRGGKFITCDLFQHYQFELEFELVFCWVYTSQVIDAGKMRKKSNSENEKIILLSITIP